MAWMEGQRKGIRAGKWEDKRVILFPAALEGASFTSKRKKF